MDVIDKAAEETTNGVEFAAIVKELELPDYVLFVGLQIDSRGSDIVKLGDWRRGNGSMQVNSTPSGYGAGYVTMEGQQVEVCVYHRDARWKPGNAQTDLIRVYLKLGDHSGSPSAQVDRSSTQPPQSPVKQQKQPE